MIYTLSRFLTFGLYNLDRLVAVFMAALCNRCGHYIFALWFLSSSFFFFFSSPNLSGRRLDIYHTSTHGVALVYLECMSEVCCTRLAENTGCKKSRQNRHLGTIAQISRAISSQLSHVSTIGKNLLNRNTSSTRLHNMVNFGLLAAEIYWRVWGTLQISTGFAFWRSYCTASSSGRQPNFAALDRGRHLCSAGWPSRWALAHISSFLYNICGFVTVWQSE